MSIRGIDTQIMINRLPDNAKEVSEVLKRPEVLQDILGNKSKLNDVIDQTKVAKTLEAEMEQIRTDVDEGSGNEYSGSDKKGRKGKDSIDEDPEMLVPMEKHIIDIKI